MGHDIGIYRSGETGGRKVGAGKEGKGRRKKGWRRKRKEAKIK